MPNAQQLVRDHAFQAFVLSSTLRVLQACAASDSSAAIATGLLDGRRVGGVVVWGQGRLAGTASHAADVLADGKIVLLRQPCWEGNREGKG